MLCYIILYTVPGHLPGGLRRRRSGRRAGEGVPLAGVRGGVYIYIYIYIYI